MRFTTFLIVVALGVIHWFAATAWMRDTGLTYGGFWSAGAKVWWDYPSASLVFERRSRGSDDHRNSDLFQKKGVASAY